VKAQEIEAEALFKSSSQQFLIPLWQRRYSWDKSDWSELWRDLIRVVDGEADNHFIGSVVLKTLPGTGLPSHAKRFWVVDGQQRITTLTILMCSIRDHLVILADEAEKKSTYESLTNQLLVNPTLAEGHRERLVLQDIDQGDLLAIIKAKKPTPSRIQDAHAFFIKELSALDIEATNTLLSKIMMALSAVWVTLEPHDNAHRVFQTLNAGGKPLRQSDLVRNYFFLLLDDQGNDFYRDRWSQLEHSLTPMQLENYFVAWSISRGHTGSKDSLFGYFQKDLASSEGNISAILRYGNELVDSAKLYSWLMRPSDAPLKHAKQSLLDLNHWGSVPAEGLLLYLLRQHSAEVIDEKELTSALELVASFFARRLLAGFEPNLHKSILVGLTRKLLARTDLTGAKLIDYLRYLLSAGDDVRTWPSNELILERVASTPLYTNSRSRWVFAILERVNRGMFAHTKHAPPLLAQDKYSIEHVLPQTLTSDWEADLKSWGVASPARLHQSRLHVLGNLSLTPINSELSNKPFAVKREMLADDWLKLNATVTDSHTWTESRIDERSRLMAQFACKVYVAPLTAEDVETSVWAGADEALPELETIESEDE
jgi:hypothetical protein